MTPVHLAAASVTSAVIGAVSFVVDGPTIAAVVAAAVTMGGAVVRTWKASVAGAARVQALEMRVTEQAAQIETLKAVVNRQAEIIESFGDK